MQGSETMDFAKGKLGLVSDLDLVWGEMPPPVLRGGGNSEDSVSATALFVDESDNLIARAANFPLKPADPFVLAVSFKWAKNGWRVTFNSRWERVLKEKAFLTGSTGLTGFLDGPPAGHLLVILSIL